jgi:hypothetical protein
VPGHPANASMSSSRSLDEEIRKEYPKQRVSREKTSLWQAEEIEILKELGKSEATHLKACRGRV